MSYYIVTSKQLISSVTMIAVFVAAAVGFTAALIDYYNLPEVYKDNDGRCVKVINYRNGDGYACQDVDVLLRKYKMTRV